MVIRVISIFNYNLTLIIIVDEISINDLCPRFINNCFQNVRLNLEDKKKKNVLRIKTN